jgi:hypothetical protein
MLPSKWKHVKTGVDYTIVGFCRRENDMAPCVIYAQYLDPQNNYTRPISEFFDGRFELLPVPR